MSGLCLVSLCFHSYGWSITYWSIYLWFALYIFNILLARWSTPQPKVHKNTTHCSSVPQPFFSYTIKCHLSLFLVFLWNFRKVWDLIEIYFQIMSKLSMWQSCDIFWNFRYSILLYHFLRRHQKRSPFTLHIILLMSRNLNLSFICVLTKCMLFRKLTDLIGLSISLRK